MDGTPPDLIKREIRARVRRARRELPHPEATRASAAVARRLWSLPELARARRIAFYLPMPDELDCMPAIIAGWRRGRQLFLPVLSGRQLCFAPFEPSTPLAPNRFGIPEPDGTPLDWHSPRELDVVVAPLVAFDPECRRLGMGGGFYDRTLAYRTNVCWKRPRFIGIAYELQKVAHLPEVHRDVRMDLVITEHASYRAST